MSTAPNCTQLHPLTDILVLSVPGHLRRRQLRGHRALRSAQRGVAAHLPGFAERHPSHDTLGRVFARLDAARFEEGFRDWVQAAFKLTGGQVVPVYGKCLRGSHDRGLGLEPLHLVSA